MSGERRTRVLLLMPSRERGGAEEHSLVTAAGLKARGFDVHAGVPGAITSGIPEALAAIDVERHVLDIGALPEHGLRGAGVAIAGDLRRTLRLVRAVRPDVCMIALPYPDASVGAVLALRAARIPTLALLHLVRPGIELGSARRLLHRLSRGRRLRLAAVSAETARRAETLLHAAAGSIQVLVNGIDPARFEAVDGPAARVRLRAELGVAPDAAVAVTVGRLNLQKGYDVLIDAVSAATAAGLDAVFAWVGTGADEPRFRALVAERGLEERIRLLGRRDDIPELVGGADLFVLPSHFEGTPLALLEALAAGVPALATETGDGGVLEGTEAGVRVPPADAPRLAAALRELLSDRARLPAMGAAGRALVRERYTRTRMLDETAAVLAELAGQPSSSARS